MPLALDSGPVDVAFGEEDDPVVDQLWLCVGPVINSMVVRMKALLNCFGVRAEEQSPFLRHFATPTELLDVYLTFVPRDHGGTDRSNGDNDEDTDSDGDGDSVTGDPGLEIGNMNRLMETIRLVVDGGTADDYSEGDNGSATNAEAADEEDLIDDEFIDDENTRESWEDELTLAEPASKFFKMIERTTMNDLIHASFEGIRVLKLDKRDKGSVTNLQRYNTLQGRWFGCRKHSEQAGGESGGRIIERGVHVTLRVGGEKISFVVTSVSSKAYNKWYMCEKGKQIWRKGMVKGKFRFQARMIHIDHASGRYNYVDPVQSHWEVKHIFVLADGSDIAAERGKVSFSLQ